MIFLRSIQKKIKSNQENQFPFSIPVIKNLEQFDFNSDITFLVGENGSGKSTFLEALACSLHSITVGDSSVEFDPSLEKARILSKYFYLTWNEKTRKGFYMRAEDFFQYSKKMNAMKSELENDLKRVDEEYKNRSKTAQMYARSGYAGQANAIENRYGKDLDAHSHGEAFIEFFKTRFIPGGLYLLDEPEAPLSPLRQISFLMLLKDMILDNSQFIIATHSPILMAYPNATLISFDQEKLKQIKYEDVSSVRTMKSFLNHPEAYLRHLEN